MEAINQAASLIRGRLTEIDEEHKRLTNALATLEGTSNGPRARKQRVSRRRGPRKLSRKEAFVREVEASPGIKTGEVAQRLRVNPNYLYRIASDLVAEGRVRKDGVRYYPVNS